MRVIFKKAEIDKTKLDETFIKAGRANEKGFTEKDADPRELAMGIEVEKEHTTDPEVAKRISLDHLAEGDSKYYTHLKEMEEKYGSK